MDQFTWAPLDERERGGHERVLRGVERNLLRKRQAEHHPRLAVVRKAMARRAVDQRIQIGDAAKRLSGNS